MNHMDLKQKEMAQILGVSASTISRELRRNSGKRGTYLKQAHQLSRQRRYKPKPRISASDWSLVTQYLKLDFSPEQISGWLKRWHLLSISSEWIYQYIHAKEFSAQFLRCKKKNRKRYGGKRKNQSICARTSITERPEVVAHRKRYGDWEVDTVIGRQGGKVLVTLVERKSKLSLMGLANNKTAVAVKETLVHLLSSVKDCLYTLTYDNGPEFAKHQEIDRIFKSKGYFARPYCSGDRGLSENTNGLIRQYLPKQTSFDDVSEKMLLWIMNRLNNRPRKTLNFRTPNELFYNQTKNCT